MKLRSIVTDVGEQNGRRSIRFFDFVQQLQGSDCDLRQQRRFSHASDTLLNESNSSLLIARVLITPLTEAQHLLQVVSWRFNTLPLARMHMLDE